MPSVRIPMVPLDIRRYNKKQQKTIPERGPNKRNFTLLGDPALKLAYPYHGRVITDSINSVAVLENIDSLKALSLITVSGHVEDLQGKYDE